MIARVGVIDRIRRCGPVAMAALLYAIAVPWAFRPWFLASNLLPHAPGPVGALADADLYLNIWILAWIAHAAFNDVAQLLDGNIFHPATGTIVGSENMLAHLAFTAPVLAITGSALAMLKAYVLESTVLSGLGMFLYVRHHTKITGAALVAGAAFAFTPFRIATVPQPQYLGFGFLPLALLAIDLHLETRRSRWLFALAAALVLQALACVYLGFFTFALAPVYALARWLAHRRGWADLLRLAGTMTASLLALIPAALPYMRGLRQGMIPDYDLAMMELASWPPGRYFSGEFVWRAGIVPVALIGLDLARRALPRAARLGRSASGGGWRSPEGGIWFLAGAAAILAAGPTLSLPAGIRVPLPYVALYDFVPGFSSLRVPIRFVIVVAAATAALAGFVFARWTRAWPPLHRNLAALLLVVAAVVAAALQPASVMSANLDEKQIAVYRWLAAQEGEGAVLEIPGQSTEQDVIGNLRNGRYMVASTVHWRPLLNGYTAYPPLSAGFYSAAIRDLPLPAALANLVDASDLRWIVLHRGDLTGREAARWPAEPPPGLALAARFDGAEIYEVTLPRTRLWRSQVQARTDAVADDTLEGTPTAPLPEHCRRGRILEVEMPSRMRAIPLGLRVPVRFSNDSDCRWPGVGIRPEGLVGLEYRWLSPSGVASTTVTPISRLLADVAARSEVEAAVVVNPPAGESGAWTLEVRLRQVGPSEPIAIASRTVELHQDL